METGWTYKGPITKYHDLGGTGEEEVLEEANALSTQDCATFAYNNGSKVHFNTPQPAYWTYKAKTKECSLVLHKGYRREAEGLVSGSSDCFLSFPAAGKAFLNFL